MTHIYHSDCSVFVAHSLLGPSSQILEANNTQEEITWFWLAESSAVQV